MTPVGLHEDGVDLFEIDGFCAVTDGFEQGAEAEVFHGAQGSFRGPYDECGGVLGKGAVRESDTIQLAVDEVLKCGGCEGVDAGGVGDSVFDVAVVAELEGGVELGLAEEDEVVVFGEVFE